MTLQTRHMRRHGHPWVTKHICTMVKRKHAATSKRSYYYLATKCNTALWESYRGYAARTRAKLYKLKRGSKAWWGLAKKATGQGAVKPCIDPVRVGGCWSTNDASKSYMFANSFAAKYTLPDVVYNVYSDLPDKNVAFYSPAVHPIDSLTESIISGLRNNSATGPDNIPARFLKECALHLVLAFRILCMRTLDEAVWPECWRLHRITPIYKKGNATDP